MSVKELKGYPNKMEKEKEELIKEAEKCWNFNNSHNIMTSQPKGVMAVSEAKKLFDNAIDLNCEEKK